MSPRLMCSVFSVESVRIRSELRWWRSVRLLSLIVSTKRCDVCFRFATPADKWWVPIVRAGGCYPYSSRFACVSFSFACLLTSCTHQSTSFTPAPRILSGRTDRPYFIFEIFSPRRADVRMTVWWRPQWLSHFLKNRKRDEKRDGAKWCLL